MNIEEAFTCAEIKHTSVIGYRSEVGRGTQLLLENPQGFGRTDHYQMQNGSQDLVNSLNLVSCETDDFHGVGYSFEISAVIDSRLERGKRSLGNLWMTELGHHFIFLKMG